MGPRKRHLALADTLSNGRALTVRPTAQKIAAGQAGYYLPTAIAPLVSRRGFETITGHKREWWLVITVSALIGAIGAALAVGARHGEPGPEIVVLGAGAAAGLAMVDIVYVSRRRISPVYLLDAAVELGFVITWLLLARSRDEQPTPPSAVASKPG